MILDLNQYTQKYLTIDLPSGKEEPLRIKLNKPSEKLKIQLMACIDEQIRVQGMLAQGQEPTVDEQINYIDMLMDLVLAILNNNRSKVKFDLDYVETYFNDIEMITALLMAYREFMEEVLNPEKTSYQLAQEAMELPLSKAFDQIPIFFDTTEEDS